MKITWNINVRIKSKPVASYIVASCLICSLLLIQGDGGRQNAFEHGLGGKLFSSVVQGKDIRLWVEVKPIIITNETRDSSYMTFRFYDGNTNQNIKFVTFSLSISHEKKLLVQEKFLASDGGLVLKFHPNENEEHVRVEGVNKDALSNAWQVKNDPPIVNVIGPIFLEGGLYHIDMDLLGFDSPNYPTVPDSNIHFNYDFGVGNTLSKQVAYNDHLYNITIISYFDKIKSVNFDAEKKMFTWSMPFDYNMTHISNEYDTFMHQELRIPKSFSEFANSTLMTAKVNNQIFTDGIALDPYTSPSENIIHYMINRNNIIRFSGGGSGINATGYGYGHDDNSSSIGNDREVMVFSYSPSNYNNTETTSRIISDTGYFWVSAQWSPIKLMPNSESRVEFNFYDAKTGEHQNLDIKYDLLVLDQNLNQVQKTTGLIAKDGYDIQAVSFPENGIYQIRVKVTNLVGLNSTALSETARLGIATGYIVVVPEFQFNISTIIIAFVIVSIVALLGRKTKLIPLS